MKAKIVHIEAQIIPDQYADTSYLGQAEFEDRNEAFKRGDFSFIGIRLKAGIVLKSKQGYTIVGTEITTPGLWGIEDDSGDEYFESVAKDEEHTLTEMLRALGFKNKAIRKALAKRRSL